MPGTSEEMPGIWREFCLGEFGQSSFSLILVTCVWVRTGEWALRVTSLLHLPSEPVVSSIHSDWISSFLHRFHFLTPKAAFAGTTPAPSVWVAGGRDARSSQCPALGAGREPWDAWASGDASAGGAAGAIICHIVLSLVFKNNNSSTDS